jgi:hypothetical protein
MLVNGLGKAANAEHSHLRILPLGLHQTTTRDQNQSRVSLSIPQIFFLTVDSTFICCACLRLPCIVRDPLHLHFSDFTSNPSSLQDFFYERPPVGDLLT